MLTRRALLRGAAGVLGATLALSIPAPAALADQPRQLEQTYLTALGLPQAWTITQGAGTTVGLLDTGADGTVQDLTGTVTSGPDYTQGANPAGVAPKEVHGTNMASIIAGHGHGAGDADGIMGVAPQARILSVRVILDDGEPGLSNFRRDSRYDDSLSQGIHYAVDHGVSVINMSLGKDLPTTADRQAVGYAISHGVVVVAAAGNDGKTGSSSTPYSYPASYPGVISVAAVDADHKRAFFSDMNSGVVVCAPGVDVYAAGPANTYWKGSGTSQASAFVSGIAALIRAKYPRLSPALVAQAIVAGTVDRPVGGYDADLGFGEVNAPGALAAAGRLAGYTMAGAGLVGSARFGADGGGPIQVVHRDRALLAICTVVGAAAVLGLFGSGVALLVRRRRY